MWPQKNPQARQAQQPQWIEQQETQDRQRSGWLLGRHGKGARLVVFGIRSLRLADHVEFKDLAFACTDTAAWELSPKGSKYAGANKAVRTAERLTSGKNADALGEVTNLAKEWTAE